jgi:8-oxo-dGTP pyrophosphatase MutT (NUDIX family)
MSRHREALQRLLSARPALELRGSRLAAVAILLREHNSGPQVFLIRRATHPTDPWSGQLAFPGGRVQSSDINLETTAIRETAEEVGIDLRQSATLLGPLDQLAARGAHASGLVVAPFVFWVHEAVLPVPEPTEVAAAFWTDLEPLLTGQASTTFELNRDTQRYRFPGYQIDDHILWGMSYQMLQPILLNLRELAKLID